MTETLPIIAARSRLTSLPEELMEPEPRAVAVTRRGQPVLAILPWELYESIVETMEILCDEKLMAAVRQGIRETGAGKGIPWEQVKKRLRL